MRSILVPAILIILWMYSAWAKWADADVFAANLRRQPLFGFAASVLFYLLPLYELMLAGLLISDRGRSAGLFLSSLTLLFFTAYVGLVISGTLWDKVPCACMGIFEGLSWTQHLVFNAAAAFLAALGYEAHQSFRKKKLNSPVHSQGAAGAGHKAYQKV